MLLLFICMVSIQVVLFSQYLDHSKSNNDGAAAGSGSASLSMLQDYLDGSKQYSTFFLSNEPQNNATKSINEQNMKVKQIQQKYHNTNSILAKSTTTNKHVKNKKNKSPPSDGTFNGYPIYKQQQTDASSSNNNVYSQLHCVGETWHPPQYWKRQQTFLDVSWQHRSCHFQYFCYDVEEKEFVLYLNQTSPTTTKTKTTNPLLDMMTAASQQQPRLYDVSQTYYNNMTNVMPTVVEHARTNKTSDIYYPYGVSIGSINGKWTLAGIPRLQWFPQVKYEQPVPFDTYDVYTLPASVVMVPFHSLAAMNPGHMVWDDFLPLYTLLQMFGFTDDENDNENDDLDDNASSSSSPSYDLLMVRFVLPPYEGDSRGLWAGCDWRDEIRTTCEKMLKKFAPLMIQQKDAWAVSTQLKPSLTFFDDKNNGQQEQQSSSSKKRLICSRHGMAGIGGLSDHGADKGHGWNADDYETTYNHGRGGQLWRFRNFMMRNIGIDRPDDNVGPDEPLIVYFSQHSSAKHVRSFDFKKEIDALQKKLVDRSEALDLPKVVVEGHTFAKYEVKEQVEMASKAAVYVTACGGGAITATFLPRGASLLLYYGETHGVKNNKQNGDPARLDWDMFNNIGYLRVHWVPQTTKYTREDIDMVTDLIIHELENIHRDRKKRPSTKTIE